MFDVHHPGFFDRDKMEGELRRLFQICHGCRLCFSFCPAFPELFERIDAHVDAGRGEAEALTSEELARVCDLCFQCKLCHVKCPYTPPHDWAVDVPHALLRAKAVTTREKGLSLQDRVLGNPDLLGKVGTAMPTFTNLANRNRLARAMMEKTFGIHRARHLPEFRSPSFMDWYRTHTSSVAEQAPCVVLFATCIVNYNDPDVGVAAVQVLEHNGRRVLASYENCCGMPWLDGGDVERAIEFAEKNVRALAPLAREGIPILVPEPTCGYMFRVEYPRLLGTPEARQVGEATRDLCEYLAGLAARGELDRSFVTRPGHLKIAYHAPCHLRAQNIGLRSRELLELTGADVVTIEKCSAFDGTWGMKKEYYELSRSYAKKLTRALADAEAELVASDCGLAGLNVTQDLGQTPLHPIQIVRDAYGLEPGYPYRPEQLPRKPESVRQTASRQGEEP